MPRLEKATQTQWHALPSDQVLEALGSSARGLGDDQARRRLASHGRNELQRAKADGPLVLLARQLKNPLLLVLIGAGLVAIAMGKPLDGGVVLAVVVLNTLIGFVQELRAGKAIEALSQMVPELATVWRDGKKAQLPSQLLVPGDVIELAAGDRVPADARLLSQKGLRVQESALTGESVPSEKGLGVLAADVELGDRRNLVFGGTLVSAGAGTAVIVETGARTQLGRISDLLQGAVALETPLTRALAKVSVVLTVGIGAVSLALLGVALWRGYPLADGLLAAITLAVAAIPEGLPAIVTIALAIGVQRMARRRAVIRKLPAVETLGSTSVICSDKTGTLTRNEMTVQAVWAPGSGAHRLSGVGYAPRGALTGEGGAPVRELPADLARLLEASALCNDAAVEEAGGRWTLAGDPTDGALLVAAMKAGLSLQALQRARPRLDEIPFESERQLMATLHALGEAERVIWMKGAPEVVLARCALSPELRDALPKRVEALASEGQRILAVAEKPAGAGGLELEDTDGGFRLLGLVGMLDPPREEAISAVQACQAAGITVKMITGDHVRTAQAIAARLGILGDGGAVSGAQLARMSDGELEGVTRRCNVFARVAPEHKLRLVKALQAHRQVVAMTGDGVNDAPALKQADIGVAMGIAGTSVAKEAADVVLADDNFASIAAAVEEGRRVYDNLVKALAFVLPTNLGLALILIASVAFFPLVPVAGAWVPLLPMLPTQLLWINLVASVTLALPLAFEAPERDVMRRSPRRQSAPILGRFVLTRTAMAAALMTAGALGLFFWEYLREVDQVGHALALREAQTMSVTAVIFFQIFYLLNCRSLKDSMFRLGVFRNRAVFVGIGVLLAAQAAFIYLPPLQRVFRTAALDVQELLLALAVGAAILPVVSFEKWYRARRRMKGPPRGVEPLAVART